MPTDQEVFDAAVLPVIKQGRLSNNPGIASRPCYYRHPQNPAIRCAVGHLIPDDQYDPSMEGSDCTQKRIVAIFDELGYTAQQRRMLLSIQAAHDYAGDIPDFTNRAREIAQKYEVNFQ